MQELEVNFRQGQGHAGQDIANVTELCFFRLQILASGGRVEEQPVDRNHGSPGRSDFRRAS